MSSAVVSSSKTISSALGVESPGPETISNRERGRPGPLTRVDGDVRGATESGHDCTLSSHFIIQELAGTRTYRPKAETTSLMIQPAAVSEISHPPAAVLMLPEEQSREIHRQIITHLDPGCPVIILAPSAADAKAEWLWLEQNKPTQKVCILQVNVSDPWLRDAMISVEGNNDIGFLVNPEQGTEAAKGLMQLAELLKVDTGVLPWPVPEGNILFDGKTVLTSKSLFVHLWQDKPEEQHRFMEEFRKLYPENCTFHALDDPFNIHLDLWLTLLPGRRILLGRTELGKAEFGKESGSTQLDYLAPFKSWEYPIREYRLGSCGGGGWETVGWVRVNPDTIRIPDTAKMDAIRDSLQQLGFQVHEIPLLAGIRIPAQDRFHVDTIRPLATYNNSLLIGDQAFVPAYGLQMDEIALEPYEACGYRVHQIKGCQVPLVQGGAARCLTNTLRSNNPDFRDFLLLRLALHAEEFPNVVLRNI